MEIGIMNFIKKKLSIFFVVILLVSFVSAKEYHVSLIGSDDNKGSASEPLKTISAAAQIAKPGDVITVHEGIYREEITPPRGGTSDKKRIVYRAAPGENVEIRGSEVVRNWTEESDGIWKVEVANSLFGDFNPFADEISGDWFNPKGRKHHTGCVYQDGEWLFEAAKKEELFTTKKKSWFAEVGNKTTTVFANFGGDNPNDSLTEVNVRQTAFYPRKPFINYITVRGFKMRHAAPKWAPPTAEQMGLIGTHWSKGWIIEGNEISHSINVGISLGKYGDEFDNAGPTAQAYLDSIDRARANGWNRATVGSHIVRNNEISWCEQAGIVGSMGASFSKITGNYIHHIYTQRRFTGAEMAGIKFHAPIDMLIEGNRIHNAFQGIWLDWMTQGTRVTRNLLYRNDLDMFLEVNHGPFVIDNNLFLSNLAKHHSQGGAYAHNIFGGVVGACTDKRHTPYFKAHSTEKVDDHVLNVGDDRFYNNIFDGNNGSHIDQGWWEGMKKHPSWRFGYGLWIYETRPQAPQTAGNIYYDGALPYTNEDAVVVKTKPDIQIEEKGDEVFLHITISPEQAKAKTQLVTTKLLGKAQVPQQEFTEPDGSPLKIDTDYFGQKRDLENPSPGPFEKPGSGRVAIKVWPKLNAKEKRDRPNIILFISDDHGWTDSGAYGDPYIKTPNIDRLVDESMRFTHAFAASPLCSPSRCVIETGLMPHRNGAHKFNTPINTNIKTMPEYFKQMGYYTAHIGKFHHTPNDRFPYDYIHKDGKKAVPFISSYDHKKPLFLLVCTKPPHTPWIKNTTYDPSKITLPPNFVDTPETREDRANYYSDVTLMDSILGDVLDTVDRKGMKDNTLFIYTTDQGANWPFGKWCLYDGGLRVPFIVRWPGRTAPGSVTDAMISLADLLPTCVDAGGCSVPRDIDGRSFVPVITGKETTHREVVFGTHTGNEYGGPGIANRCPARTIRTPTHRYILNLSPETTFTTHITGCKYWDSWVEKAKTDPKAKAVVDRYQHRPREELYDLRNDPFETNNLAESPEQAKLLESLRRQLAEWCKTQGDTIALEHLTK